jgi:hypothetical protein
MEENLDHPPNARGVVFAESLGALSRLIGGHAVVKALERIDADDTDDTMRHEQGGLDSGRAAEQVSQKDNLFQIFGLDGFDVRAELGDTPFGTVGA